MFKIKFDYIFLKVQILGYFFLKIVGFEWIILRSIAMSRLIIVFLEFKINIFIIRFDINEAFISTHLIINNAEKCGTLQW